MLVSPSLGVSEYGMYSCCGSGGLGYHYYCALSQIGGGSYSGSALVYVGGGADGYGRYPWIWGEPSGTLDFYVACLG